MQRRSPPTVRLSVFKTALCAECLLAKGREQPQGPHWSSQPGTGNAEPGGQRPGFTQTGFPSGPLTSLLSA